MAVAQFFPKSGLGMFRGSGRVWRVGRRDSADVVLLGILKLTALFCLGDRWVERDTESEVGNNIRLSHAGLAECGSQCWPGLALWTLWELFG